ncbi:MAG: 23S rRNA (uracil(1939)-C(5))-methyltransferase RlmD [Nitrospirota bacterium]
MSANRIVTVTVEKLIDGGAGLGRVDGRVIFVPGVCPGERVRARITAVKPGYAEAALESVEQASADRVRPPCPVFGRCGGCQWQHLSDPAQARAKVDILREDLRRLAKLDKPALLDPIAAPEPYGYRSRIQVKIDASGAKPRIGFYAAKSRQIVTMEQCPVAAPPLNRAVAALRTCLADPATRLSSMSEIHWHLAQGTGELQSRYFAAGEPKKRVEAFLTKSAASLPELVSQVYYDRSGHRRVWGRDWITDHLHGRPFRISDRSFAQVNWAQNQAMIEAVLGFAALTGRESVLELFCGIGNFGLFLAEQAATLEGYDENPSAVADARYNAEQQRRPNCRFQAGPVDEVLEGLIRSGRRFDCIVLDPPREGLQRAALNALLKLAPARIVYISCVPATLARDLRRFGDGGYRVGRIQPIDLFPQTPYLETVTELIAPTGPQP